MAQAVVDLAKRAGSFQRFQAAIDGNAPTGLTLSAREAGMLRTIAAKGGSGGTKSLGAWGSGRTWEGSAMLHVTPKTSTAVFHSVGGTTGTTTTTGVVGTRPTGKR
jgi:hypothetical protein